MPADPTSFAKPSRSSSAEGGAAPVLVAVTGLFAVIVGVLLRAAVESQDRTDWNGTVEGVLQGLPIVLIIVGLGVLLWGAVLVARGRAVRQDELSPRAPRPPGPSRD
ncbi:MAG: hypothetical protein J7513_10850 [Solirubrobacteraceae bacterium]|nr:hypothetical protein [Solirubrobacteraceae bacterium]